MRLMPVVVADLANLSVVVLALLVMAYVSYKVYKFTNMTDKALFLVIIFLDLTLIGKLFLAPSLIQSHFSIAYIVYYASRISIFTKQESDLITDPFFIENHFDHCIPAVI